MIKIVICHSKTSLSVPFVVEGFENRYRRSVVTDTVGYVLKASSGNTAGTVHKT